VWVCFFFLYKSPKRKYILQIQSQSFALPPTTKNQKKQRTLPLLAAMQLSNPFSRDGGRNLTAYKVMSLLTFLLQFVATIYLANHAVHGVHNSHSIFGMSNLHVTPFTLSHVFVVIYWIVLWIFQAVYMSHLFSSDETATNSATAVGAHFILFNVLHFVWALLWCTGHPILSEIVVIFNFFNVAGAYLRHPSTTRAPNFVHLAVSALPLTFQFFLLLWNGAVMFHCHNNLLCRILANVTVWGITGFAGFFLLGFSDFYVGFATTFLAAGLGVGQFFTKVVALQWPFAFTVMSICFIGTCAVASGAIGRESSRTGESAPLLRGEA
jgi:hypothetical protein